MKSNFYLSSLLHFLFFSLSFSMPSSFLYPSRLFFSEAPDVTDQPYLIEAIQCFLKLCKKNIIAAGTSEVASQLLREGWAPQQSFKNPIPRSSFDSCNVSAWIHFSIELSNVVLIIGTKALMCLCYWIEADDCTMGDFTWGPWRVGGKSYCSMETLLKSFRLSEMDHACRSLTHASRHLRSTSNFRLSQLTENRRLTALRNNLNADADVLSFSSFLQALDDGRIPCDEKERITFSPPAHSSKIAFVYVEPSLKASRIIAMFVKDILEGLFWRRQMPIWKKFLRTKTRMHLGVRWR